MKTVAARDLQKNVRECIDAAQRDRIVITRHGKPTAILLGVEGEDWEDVLLRASPAFWKMISRRRKEKAIPLPEARRRLEARWAPRQRRQRRGV